VANSAGDIDLEALAEEVAQRVVDLLRLQKREAEADEWLVNFQVFVPTKGVAGPQTKEKGEP